MAFIDRLKAARLEKKLTQEQLAKEIGVAKPTYNGYEKGNSEPNMLILSKLMKVLGVDANYLFQDEMQIHRETHATPTEMEHIKGGQHSLYPLSLLHPVRQRRHRHLPGAGSL